MSVAKERTALRWMRHSILALAALIVIGVLVWQGVTSGGNPSTDVATMSPAAVAVNAGILVFREGLEAVLVLAALTASLTRTTEGYWKPVGIGAGLSFLATIVTWFVVVGLISVVPAPEYDIQAGTGLLAVVVLLIIMNWFFHKLYWTGWITHHNRRKRDVMETAGVGKSLYQGLLLVGFTSVYREGFEVVLFLQGLKNQAGAHGTQIVMIGAGIGLLLTAIVAVLTFVAHAKLPYRKMLIATGIMLGFVLFVMVGETMQEMAQAKWFTPTQIGTWPDWLGTWFAVFPWVQSLAAQVIAVVYVVGTYAFARMLVKRRHLKARQTVAADPIG